AFLSLIWLASSRRRSRPVLFSCVVALAIAIVSAAISAGIGGVLSSPTRDVANPSEQLVFIRNDPWSFVAVCLYTFRISVLEYARQIVGVLGWLQTPLPTWVYSGMWIAFALSTGFQLPGKTHHLSLISRVFCILLSICVLLG